MHILLSQQNLQAAVLLFVQDRFNLAEDESLSVELTEDGAIVTVLSPGEQPEVHTPVNQGQAEAPSTPTRRGRRTKAQIAADEEAARQKALSESTPTASNGDQSKFTSGQVSGQPEAPWEEPENPQTPSVEGASATESASSSDAATDPADPAPVVVEEEPDQEPAEEPAPPAESKPVNSLFANLRRPSNA